MSASPSSDDKDVKDVSSQVSEARGSPTKSAHGDISEHSPENQAHAPHPTTKLRFFAIFLSLMLCVFLFALDQLIVATAIPRITDEFNSLTQLPWIANGFFMTLFAFNLAWAQWTSIIPAKHIVLLAIFIFELGSLLCGVAPNMDILILGRVVAGVGGGGIFNGAPMVITEITTMAERAKVFGFMGVNFAVASVLGPLVGGAFADHISWRWCFYINLPIGGVAMGLIVLLVGAYAPVGRQGEYAGYSFTMLKQLLRCDWVGVAILLAFSVAVNLALQEAGITKDWSDASVITEWVMTPVLAIMFIAWELYLGDRAMLPLTLFKRKLITSACVISLSTQGAMMFLIYYLSEGLQAVYHTSATVAGIDLLPFVTVNVVSLITAGRLVAKFGRPWPLLIAGPLSICVGSGLLYTIKWTDPKSYPMGYSVLSGLGACMVIQNVIILAQYEFHKEPRYIAQGTGVVTFTGFLGRIYGIGLAGSVFGNMIKVNLTKYAPELSAELRSLVENDATAVWGKVPDDMRDNVLNACVKTLGEVYIIGVPMAGLALIAALTVGNIKMDMKAGHGPSPAKSDAESTSADEKPDSGASAAAAVPEMLAEEPEVVEEKA